MTIQWDEVSRARLRGGLLMLFSGGQYAWVIPLRDVAPDVQANLFQLIRRHVPRTHGF